MHLARRGPSKGSHRFRTHRSHPPSPASKAGIQPGDVILRFNDTEVSSPAVLSTLVAKTAIGSKAKVVVFRDGGEVTLEAAIGQRPPLE